MLLVHPIRELIRAIPLLAALLIANRASHGPPWSLIGVAIVVGRGVLRWFTTSYRINADQLQIRRSLFMRKVSSARLDRIRTVDLSAHPLQRALGLVKVEIGTGTSDRKSETFALDGLRLNDATTLRGALLRRRDDAVGATGSEAEPPVPETETELVRLQLRWVLYAPATLSGAITGLFLLGLAWRIGSEANVHPDRVRVLHQTLERVRSTPVWLDAIEAVVAASVIVAALSAAGYVIAFWGFRLSRFSGGSIHVSRGLLTTRETTLEERRLRGLELSEPILLRAVAGARVIAIATGLRVGRGAERGGTLLLPPAPRDEALRVSATILGTGAPMTLPLEPHGPRARRRRFTRALGPTVIAVALIAGAWRFGPLPGWVALASLATLPLAGFVAADRAANLGHAVLDDTGRWLVSRHGSLVRRRVVLAADGVVGVKIRRSLFQRRAGLASVVATTAAGRQAYVVRDLPDERANELAAELLPGLLGADRRTARREQSRAL